MLGYLDQCIHHLQYGITLSVCASQGLALTYVLENSFKAESGSRPGVPKIGILITDGKSQDDVIPPAQSLRDAGIELFAIGKKGSHIVFMFEHMIVSLSFERAVCDFVFWLRCMLCVFDLVLYLTQYVSRLS